MHDVKQERTGWRDESLSLRHRMWGFDCPAVDIDFLMVEFDHGKVCAMVEYKNEYAAPQYPSHPSYKALKDFADRGKVPLFACRYTSDFSKFTPSPLNGLARGFLSERSDMTEKEWVALLYKIRGRLMPKLDFFEQPI